LASASTTQVSSTPEELNLLDGSTANTVVNSKAVIYGSSGEVAGTLSTAAQTAITSLGTLIALTVDDVAVNGKVITMTGSTGDTAVFTVGTAGTLSLVTTDADGTDADLSVDADGQITIDANDAAGIFLGINGTNQINLVDGVLKPVTDNDVDLGVSGGPEFKNGYFNGTLEADAITIGGTNVVSGSLITTLGTVSAGVWQGTVVAEAYLPNAGAAAQGVVELATAAETSTGTDTDRAVTPDGLAGSVHGEKVIQMVVIDFATALTTGDGKFYFHVPSTLNGFDIVDVHAEVITAPAGSTIIIQLHNLTATADILSTLLTIDASETGSDTAATAAVISGSEDDLTTNDVIRVDIDQIGSSTAGSGLIVTLICRLP